MCCFTVNVRDVHGTYIFVAPVSVSRQVVVYFNSVKLEENASSPAPAMILPFPSRGGKVQLLDLSKDESFFHDLSKSFPVYEPGILSSSTSSSSSGYGNYLPVHRVGGYNVSFFSFCVLLVMLYFIRSALLQIWNRSNLLTVVFLLSLCNLLK